MPHIYLIIGKDCVGNAKTGEGKTVSFAVPILQALSKDPYGIFALVLTPTRLVIIVFCLCSSQLIGGLQHIRELAFQIADQFNVIGAPLDIRTTVVVGGMDMMSQMIAMNERPHVVVATPGRLVDLIHDSSGQWSLGRIKFLVSLGSYLDARSNCNRLRSRFSTRLIDFWGLHLRRIYQSSFPKYLKTDKRVSSPQPSHQLSKNWLPRSHGQAKRDHTFIVIRTNQSKQTPKLRHRVIADPDVAGSVETVDTLKQQYILCPSHVREVYLNHLLRHPPESILHLRREPPVTDPRKLRYMKRQKAAEKAKRGEKEIGVLERVGKGKKKAKSNDDDGPPTQPPPTIIFVTKSQTAEYITVLLKQLGFRATALHSRLPQPKRLTSLGLFRAHVVPILVCTDVGARGLDMDDVGMVINWDLPQSPKRVVKVAGENGEVLVMPVEIAPGDGSVQKALEGFQSAEDTYVHRVGRTARMGRGGVAISFVTEKKWDADTVTRIEDRISALPLILIRPTLTTPLITRNEAGRVSHGRRYRAGKTKHSHGCETGGLDGTSPNSLYGVSSAKCGASRN